jgi:hypothetical protein
MKMYEDLIEPYQKRKLVRYNSNTDITPKVSNTSSFASTYSSPENTDTIDTENTDGNISNYYLDDIIDTMTKQSETEKSLVNQNYANTISGVQTQQTQNENYYRQQKSQATAQSVIGQRVLQEQQAASGQLNTGAGQTARIMYDISMNNYIAQLDTEQQTALNTLMAEIRSANLSKATDLAIVESNLQSNIQTKKAEEQTTFNNVLAAVNTTDYNTNFIENETELNQKFETGQISQKNYDYALNVIYQKAASTAFTQYYEGVDIRDFISNYNAAKALNDEIQADPDMTPEQKKLFADEFAKLEEYLKPKTVVGKSTSDNKPETKKDVVGITPIPNGGLPVTNGVANW